MTALFVFTALILDRVFGEPHRFHPLAGFGRLAQFLERYLHGDSLPRGVIAVALLLAPFTLLTMLVDRLAGSIVLDVVLLYLAIGWQSLGEHAGRVRDALLADDLPAARQAAGCMVSRDTAALDREDAAKAGVESVLENGNDAIFGAIFWFAIAGASGVVLYRLANTLDAMWGYRNERYRHFGWAAARFDDLLNVIPARLTALTYAVLGQTRQALHCWRTQAPAWDSPNAGPVMAAGAGALGLTLGGPACYQGEWHQRPVLGVGRAPDMADIERALGLVRHGVWLWVGLLLIIGGLTYV